MNAHEGIRHCAALRYRETSDGRREFRVFHVARPLLQSAADRLGCSTRLPMVLPHSRTAPKPTPASHCCGR